MKFKHLLLPIFFSVSSFNSFADDSPLSLSLYSKNGSYAGMSFTNVYLEVTSITDSITINGLEVNRGNCRMKLKQSTQANFGNERKLRLPITIGYGNNVTFSASASKCTPREVVLSTDQGDWTYTFNY